MFFFFCTFNSQNPGNFRALAGNFWGCQAGNFGRICPPQAEILRILRWKSWKLYWKMEKFSPAALFFRGILYFSSIWLENSRRRREKNLRWKFWVGFGGKLEIFRENLSWKFFGCRKKKYRTCYRVRPMRIFKTYILVCFSAFFNEYGK